MTSTTMINATNLNTDERLKQLPFIKRALWRQGPAQRRKRPSSSSRPRLLAALRFPFVIALTLLLAGCGNGSYSTSGPNTSTTSTPDRAAIPDNLTLCPDERPEICTQQYDPACGYFFPEHSNGGLSDTYGNSCTACVDPLVKGYTQGACPNQEGD